MSYTYTYTILTIWVYATTVNEDGEIRAIFSREYAERRCSVSRKEAILCKILKNPFRMLPI